jgi:putative DNA primase/helicase
MVDDDGPQDGPTEEQTPKVVSLEKEKEKRTGKRPKCNDVLVYEHMRDSADLRNVIMQDDFTMRLIKRAPLPGEPHERPFPLRLWGKGDDIRLLHLIQKRRFPDCHIKQVERALVRLAEDNADSLLMEALAELPSWDGVPRIHAFFIDICGAKPQNEWHLMYLCEVARKTWLALIARAMEPGCKQDYVPILGGAQGIEKSKLLKSMALRPEWFSDTMPTRLDRDAADHVRGKQIIEWSELALMRGGGRHEDVKRFASIEVDAHRSAYGHHEVHYRRQCVFFGTTNEDAYLTDLTGNRRFFPIDCGDINLHAFIGDKLQYYAEALHHYSENQLEWWKMPDGFWNEADRQTRDKLITVSELEQTLTEKIDEEITAIIRSGHNRNRHAMGSDCYAITAKDARQMVFEYLPEAQVNETTEKRVAAILRKLGFIKKQTTYGARQVFWWRKLQP